MNESTGIVELHKSDFEWFRNLIEKESGIFIHENKYNFLYNRLYRRMKILKIRSCLDYRQYLRTDEGRKQELDKLLDEVVTAESSFFRYQPHLDMFCSVMLHDLINRRIAKGLQIKIVSMGCASGEEPYTLAMLLCEKLPVNEGNLIRIDAVDLSESLLSRAREAFYSADDVSSIPGDFLERYFIKERHGYRLISRVSRMVNFYRFNMVNDDWNHFRFTDLIFCRNTIIYFSEKARKRAISNIVECLKDGGYCVLGHAEIINTGEFGIKHIGNNVYRKEPT